MNPTSFQNLISEHHQIALRNPCRTPQDLIHARYLLGVHVTQETYCKIALTVNVGEAYVFDGNPLWMASVSIEGRPLRAEWGEAHHMLGEYLIGRVFNGIGLPPDHVVEGRRTLMARRQCSVSEREFLLQQR